MESIVFSNCSDFSWLGPLLLLKVRMFLRIHRLDLLKPHTQTSRRLSPLRKAHYSSQRQAAEFPGENKVPFLQLYEDAPQAARKKEGVAPAG